MNTKHKIILAVLALTLTSGAGYYLITNNRSEPTDTTKVKDSIEQVPNEDNEDASSQDNGLPKPILNKSSGNVAPVDNGIIVQFTCEGTPDAFCKISLVKVDGTEKIELPIQQIKDDGRGQAFVSWDWEAQEGSWDVTATLSKEGFSSTSSGEQRLVVR